MRRVGRRRHIASRYLVLTLGSGLYARQPVLNGILDGLVIAELEMQERVVLNGPPMTAEQRVGTDEIDCAGNPPLGALGHYQKDAVAHLLADQRIERAREIGATPLAGSGLHVEFEEGIPHAFRKLG